MQRSENLSLSMMVFLWMLQCNYREVSLGVGTNVVFPVVGTYVEVWGVAQRRRCLRGMLSLHAEMLVSPNATNQAA